MPTVAPNIGQLAILILLSVCLSRHPSDFIKLSQAVTVGLFTDSPFSVTLMAAAEESFMLLDLEMPGMPNVVHSGGDVQLPTLSVSQRQRMITFSAFTNATLSPFAFPKASLCNFNQVQHSERNAYVSACFISVKALFHSG